MSRAIFCLVFVAIVASIGQGRIIEKRSPGGASDLAERSADYYENDDYTYDHGYDTYDHGYETYDYYGKKKRSPGFADFADQIDKAVDLRDIGGHIDTAVDEIKGAANDVEDAIDDAGSAIEDFFGRKKRSPGFADFADQIDEAVDLKAIGGHIDTAIDEVEDFGSGVGDAFVDAGSAIGDFFGRKKRSPGVADLADQIDEAVDLKVIGGHIDTAIDAVEDFGSDAIDEIKDFANSDGVRRVGNKVVDVANDVGDAFVDAGSAIGDFFGGLGKRSAAEVLYNDNYVYYEVIGEVIGEVPGDDYYHEDSGYY